MTLYLYDIKQTLSVWGSGQNVTRSMRVGSSNVQHYYELSELNSPWAFTYMNRIFFSCFFELIPDVFIPPGPSGDSQLWVFYLKLGQSSLEFLKQNFIKYTCLKSSEKCWRALICLLSSNLLFLALHFRYMNVELMFSSLWPASCWRNQPIRSSLCWTL